MHILLFVLYAVVLSAIVFRSKFIKRAGLEPVVIVLLFLATAAVGCFHDWLAYRYYPNHGDIWHVFQYSLDVKYRLVHDVAAFRKEFFPEPFSVDLAGKHMGWTTDELQGLAVIQLLLNFLSFDNHYINTLFFCFVTLFGKVALLRTLRELYPDHEIRALALVFLIPSVVFWTSVIHKEAILFSAIGLSFFCFQRMIKGRSGFKHVLVMCVALAIIFVTRKMTFVFLMPTLAGWWLAEKKYVRPALAVAVSWFALAVIFIILANLAPPLNILNMLAGRQAEFLTLHGSSKLFTPVLEPRIGSFFSNLPYAVFKGLLMPLPGSGGRWVYAAFGIELLVIWLILGNYYRRKGLKRMDGFAWATVVFALAGCIIIGFTVPFAGAIVRYRSILLFFMLVPVLATRAKQLTVK